MNLLAIDTCSSVLSIAVSFGDEILSTDTESNARQSELVMDCIDSLIKKADLNPRDLDGVLCMGGPGSFTGLRIGFSSAKGISYSLSIPFIAVPTLDCIAFSQQAGLTLAAVEARKNAWFFAVYKDSKIILPAIDADAAETAREIEKLNSVHNEKITIAGHGAVSLFESLPRRTAKTVIAGNEKRGFSKELIAIAKKMNLLDNKEKFEYSGPEYIRKTDAELNLKKNME